MMTSNGARTRSGTARRRLKATSLFSVYRRPRTPWIREWGACPSSSVLAANFGRVITPDEERERDEESEAAGAAIDKRSAIVAYAHNRIRAGDIPGRTLTAERRRRAWPARPCPAGQPVARTSTCPSGRWAGAARTRTSPARRPSGRRRHASTPRRSRQIGSRQLRSPSEVQGPTRIDRQLLLTLHPTPAGISGVFPDCRRTINLEPQPLRGPQESPGKNGAAATECLSSACRRTRRSASGRRRTRPRARCRSPRIAPARLIMNERSFI